MLRRRILLSATVSVMLVLGACGSPHTTAGFNGGNNAPVTKPGPTATTAPEKPGTTTTTFPLSKNPGPTHATPDNPQNMDKTGTPEWVAAQYQRYAGSVSYTWPNIDEWIITAKPYMSPTYWATLRAQAGQPLSPAQTEWWRQVVTEQIGYWVHVESSVIAVNAPRTPTSCTVVVHYITGVVKPNGTREPSSGPSTTLAYPMVKIGGTWYVNGPGGTAYGT